MKRKSIPRKKNKKPSSTGSSSSRKTEIWSSHAKTLELGDYLVHELELDNSVDTLGRWMAHHLAETIHKAETEVSEAKIKAAQKLAVDLIFKIWAHRESLPGMAYPLARYKEAVQMLEWLNPSRGQFGHGRPKPNSIEGNAFVFSENSRKLIVALILINSDWRDGLSKSIEVKALTRSEKTTLQAYKRLEDWLFDQHIQIYLSQQEASSETRNISAKALDLIDELTANLKSLRRELKKRSKS